MNRFCKVISFALVTTMVLGSTFTSLASNGDRTTSSIGSGSLEGSINQQVWEVDLPTVEEGSTPFDYIMDPQRLISRTKYARFKYATFPDADVDTGVYFNHGLETNAEYPSNALQKFDNESVRTTVTNMSSDDIEVTVKVEAGQTNVPLVESGDIKGAKITSLYIGLAYDDKKGATTDEPVTVLADTPALKRLTVKGNENNFDLVYDPEDENAVKGYVYRAKEDVEATSWENMDFYLKGEVTGQEVPAGTEADLVPPQLTVTWSWQAVEDIPTVTFINAEDGTVLGTQIIHEGETLVKPANPTMIGIDYTYSFGDWYKTPQPTIDDEPFVFENAVIDDDLKLYAVFNKEERPYGFYSEDVTIGDNGASSITLTHSPAFSSAAEIEAIWVNGNLIDNYRIIDNGTLLLVNVISSQFDEYEVHAIIDGRGYKKTYTKPNN